MKQSEIKRITKEIVKPKLNTPKHQDMYGRLVEVSKVDGFYKHAIISINEGIELLYDYMVTVSDRDG